MNNPKINENRQIDLSAVLNTYPEDFKDPSLDVQHELLLLQNDLFTLPIDINCTYTAQKMNLLSNRVLNATTPEIQGKHCGYILPNKYCFWQNIYALFMKQGRYWNKTEEESKEIDKAILECEIKRTLNPNSLFGRTRDHAVLGYVEKKLIIKPGTTVFGNQTEIYKKAREITVHHILVGHYSFGVEHPKLCWKQRGEWKAAYIKDLFP